MGVCEVASVMIGDAYRFGSRRKRLEVEASEKLEDILNAMGEGLSGGFLRGTAKEDGVFFHGGATSGGGREDDGKFRTEALDVLPGGGLGFLAVAEVPGEGAAATLPCWDFERDALHGEDAFGCGMDARIEDALRAAAEQSYLGGIRRSRGDGGLRALSHGLRFERNGGGFLARGNHVEEWSQGLWEPVGGEANEATGSHGPAETHWIGKGLKDEPTGPGS